MPIRDMFEYKCDLCEYKDVEYSIISPPLSNWRLITINSGSNKLICPLCVGVLWKIFESEKKATAERNKDCGKPIIYGKSIVFK